MKLLINPLQVYLRNMRLKLSLGPNKNKKTFTFIFCLSLILLPHFSGVLWLWMTIAILLLLILSLNLSQLMFPYISTIIRILYRACLDKRDTGQQQQHLPTLGWIPVLWTGADWLWDGDRGEVVTIIIIYYRQPARAIYSFSIPSNNIVTRWVVAAAAAALYDCWLFNSLSLFDLRFGHMYSPRLCLLSPRFRTGLMNLIEGEVTISKWNS